MSKIIAHLTAAELRRLFDPVFPFASTNDMLPVLTGVHLTAKDGYLVASATDRFRVGFSRVRPELVWDKAEKRAVHESVSDNHRPIKVPGDVDLLIPAGSLQRALRLFKNPRGTSLHDMPVMTLTVDEMEAAKITGEPRRTLTITAAGDLVGGLKDLAVTIDLLAGEYPKTATLFSKNVVEEVGGYTAFNPDFLDAFRVACRVHGESTVVWKIGAGRKPSTAYVGTDFVGLLMPRMPVGHTGSDDYDAKASVEVLSEQWSGFLS